MSEIYECTHCNRPIGNKQLSTFIERTLLGRDETAAEAFQSNNDLTFIFFFLLCIVNEGANRVKMNQIIS